MGCASKLSNQRPRELRRRVVIPARIRTEAQWSDACILNISSRGLMIHAGRAGPEGSTIELRRGDHVIIAHLVWRDGARAGLQCEDRLPVEEIMSLGRSNALRIAAPEGAVIERRKTPRKEGIDARSRGRLLEFIVVGALAFGLSLTLWAMVVEALVNPFREVQTALGG